MTNKVSTYYELGHIRYGIFRANADTDIRE